MANKSGKKSSEMREKRERPLKKNKSFEEKTKRQISFYTKERDIKSAFYINQPMFVFL